MGPEFSSLPSLKPANCPYPEPDQPSRCQISCRRPHLTSHRSLSPSPRLCETGRSIVSCCGQLLVHRQTPKLEDHPLSAVRDCLFGTFAATLHVGGRSDTQFNWHTEDCCPVGCHAVLFGMCCLKKQRGYRPTAACLPNKSTVILAWRTQMVVRVGIHTYTHIHSVNIHINIHACTQTYTI